MRTLQFFEATSRALLRLAPPCFRHEWQAELIQTVRESCLAAHRAGGWRGLMTTGVLEMSNVGESAIRARLGGGPPVTGGSPNAPHRDTYGKGTRAVQTIAHDLRLALRSLLATKTAVAIAIGTLALGIGINAAVFSILDSTVLRPVPFTGADRMEEIWTFYPDSGISTPNGRNAVVLEWRTHEDIFDRVEAHDITSFVLENDVGAEMLTGAFVTPGLMPMLGVQPVVGRLLTSGDGRAGAPHRVVISEGLWHERFRGDPDVLDRAITFNGTDYRIVGVMPASFHFPSASPTFWVPFDLTDPPVDTGVAPESLVPFARLRDGLPPDVAAEIVEARGEAVHAAAGATDGRSAKIGMKNFVDVRTSRSLYLVAGAVGFLLLIVCANLANLSLSRALGRTRDFAVRGSLGASRFDLMRETLVEHLVIGVVGAGLGLVVAQLTLGIVLDQMPSSMLISSMNEVDLDTRALLFTAGAGVLTAVLFGLPPAWLASRSGVAVMLKQSSRSATGSRGSRRLRSALVVSEVTLALVLLVGAALMARSFVKLQAVDRGFASDGLLTVRLGLPTTGYADRGARDQFTDAMIDGFRLVPGVQSASAGSVAPNSDLIRFGQLEFADRPGEETDLLILPIYQVWPDYFDTVGLPLVAGRPFADGEPRTSIIVSESFAEQHFEGSAVGSRFRFGDDSPWREIVGVSGEVRQFTLDDAQGSFEFYEPLRQPPGEAAPAPRRTGAIADYRTFVVRADNPAAVAEPLRQAVNRQDRGVVVWRIESIDKQFADAVARPRLVLLLMTVFAGLGLVLAAAGIYGVLSYLVAQRRRELGIRLALGAVPRQIGRLVLANGLKLTAIGLVIGVAASLGLMRVMRSLLYEVEPTDPLSVAVTSCVLLATAFVAAWWPSRRAMRVDPVILLREE